jgi:hypothetical protein
MGCQSEGGTGKTYCIIVKTPLGMLATVHSYLKFEELRSIAETFNLLTPELNPSAQRCLTRFFTGVLLLEPCILLIHA